MDQLGGPAVLGGIITGLMLWAWALGRWQRGFGAAPVGSPGTEPLSLEPHAFTGNAAAAVRTCEQTAFDERLSALDASGSLGQLHAEVSAYRRTEQVLAHLEADEMALCQSAVGMDGAARGSIGISGQSTAPIAGSPSAPCACGTCGGQTPGLSIRLDQPSAEPSAFTRV